MNFTETIVQSQQFYKKILLKSFTKLKGRGSTVGRVLFVNLQAGGR